MSHVRHIPLRVAAALLFALAGAAWSQSDLSTITGTVKDSSGSSVPGAKVSVRNEGTGITRDTNANDAGVYTVSNIPAGTYTVTVDAQGFKKYTKTGNLLDANVPLGVDIDLEIGANTEVVNVTAEASRLQTESATLGLTVDQRQVRDLMLNGRNPVLLASLKPGVRSSASLSNFNFNLTDGGFSMNGSRPNDNVFFYDGAVATRTRSNGTSIGAADVDSTEEVQILTSNYAAEYGRSGGGQVRVVTKSGSRDFHGTAYEFFRNSAMDANTWARNISPLTLPERPAAAAEVQPVRLRRQRSGLHSRQVQYGPEQAVLPVQPGVAPLPDLAHQHRHRAQPGHAAGELQRTAGAEHLLLQAIHRDRPQRQCPSRATSFRSRRSPNGIALMSVSAPIPGFQLGTSNYIGLGNEIDNTRKDTISLDIMPTEKDTIRVRVLNYSFFVANAFQGTFPMAANQLNRPNQTGVAELDPGVRSQPDQRGAGQRQRRPRGHHPARHRLAAHAVRRQLSLPVRRRRQGPSGQDADREHQRLHARSTTVRIRRVPAARSTTFPTT